MPQPTDEELLSGEIEPYGGPITFAEDRKPWERQEGESDRTWLLFCIYRDMEPWERSLQGAYRKYLTAIGKPNPHAIASFVVNSDSVQYRFVDRVHLYDRYIDETAIRDITRRKIRARVAAAELGETMKERALQAVRLLQSVSIERVRTKEGTTTRAKSNLSVRDIVQLAKVGNDLEFTALGMNEGSQGLSLNINVNAGTPQSDDEVVSRAARILKERQQLIDLEAKHVSGPDS